MVAIKIQNEKQMSEYFSKEMLEDFQSIIADHLSKKYAVTLFPAQGIRAGHIIGNQQILPEYHRRNVFIQYTAQEILRKSNGMMVRGWDIEILYYIIYDKDQIPDSLKDKILNAVDPKMIN